MDLPDVRMYIVGLLVDCPYEPNPKDCALHDIRKKSMEEKLAFSKRLTEEEAVNIIAVHKKCLCRKEGKRG